MACAVLIQNLWQLAHRNRVGTIVPQRRILGIRKNPFWKVNLRINQVARSWQRADNTDFLHEDGVQRSVVADCGYIRRAKIQRGKPCVAAKRNFPLFVRYYVWRHYAWKHADWYCPLGASFWRKKPRLPCQKFPAPDGNIFDLHWFNLQRFHVSTALLVWQFLLPVRRGTRLTYSGSRVCVSSGYWPLLVLEHLGTIFLKQHQNEDCSHFWCGSNVYWSAT